VKKGLVAQGESINNLDRKFQRGYMLLYLSKHLYLNSKNDKNSALACNRKYVEKFSRAMDYIITILSEFCLFWKHMT
jgi:hypothetical protein